MLHTPNNPRLKLRTRPMQSLRLTGLALAIQALALQAHGQSAITPIKNASGQLATMDKSPTGVPVVNIPAPTTAGVSTARYSKFDTSNLGVILNNVVKERVNTAPNPSSSGGPGGYVYANPLLQGTPARIIVNEVASSALTTLRGNIEVAGAPANVVVANPLGITCDGCGFINTPRISMVAGTVVFDAAGNISYLRSADNAGLTISAAGLKVPDAVLDLIGFTTRIDGNVAASDISLMSEALQVDYATRSLTPRISTNTTTPSLYISSTGGIQSKNGIYIVTGENTWHGNSSAGTGGVTLIVKGGGINNSFGSKLTSAGDVSFTFLSPNTQKLNGTISSQGSITLNSTKLEIHKELTAQGSISIGAPLLANGSIDPASTLTLIYGGALKAQQDINIQTGRVRTELAGEGAYTDGTTFNPSIEAGRQLSINALNISLGEVSSGYGAYKDHGPILLSKITGGNGITLSADKINLSVSDLKSTGNVNLIAQSKLSSNIIPVDTRSEELKLSDPFQEIKQRSTIQAGQDLNIISGGTLDLKDLRAQAGGDIYISGKADLANGQKDIISAGKYTSGGDLTILSSGSLGIGVSQLYTSTPWSELVFTSKERMAAILCNIVTTSFRCNINPTNLQTFGTIEETRLTPAELQAGGNVVLQSTGGVVNLDGTSITAGGSVIVAGQGVGIIAPKNVKFGHKNQDNTYTEFTERTLSSGLVKAGGDISILATGNAQATDPDARSGDILLTAAQLVSDNGHVSLAAADDTTIANDIISTDSFASYYKKKRRLFYSKTEQWVKQSHDETIIPSLVGGQTVSINAGHDIDVIASDIQGTGNIGIRADNDLTLASAEERDTYDYSHSIKKSGLYFEGGSFTIGSKRLNEVTSTVSEQQTGTSISTLLGDINLSAGNQYVQVSSELVAPLGNISITAAEIALTTNNNTYTVMNSIAQRQSGLTVGLSHPLVSAATTAIDTVKATSRTGNTHTQALGALTAALTGYNAYTDIRKAINNAGGNVTKALVDSLSLNISLGYSSSEFNSVYNQVSPAEVSIRAGGDVSLSAVGAPEEDLGSITVRGAQISAGRALTLDAASTINLFAAEGLSSESSTNKAKSASIGLSFSLDGKITGNLAVNNSRGFTNGAGKEYVHVGLTAGNADPSGMLTLKSGYETQIHGATLSGYGVYIGAGLTGQADLTIASVQDTNFYDANQKSWGISVSVPIPVSGNVDPKDAKLGLSYSDFKLLQQFQSAREQTAVRAGKGGYFIDVSGKTILRGAALADAPGGSGSVIQTDTLSMTDIKNTLSTTGSANDLKVQLAADTKLGGSGYGYAEINQSAMGDTKAAIAPSTLIALVNGNYRQQYYDAQYNDTLIPGSLPRANRPKPPATPFDTKVLAAKTAKDQAKSVFDACTTDACRATVGPDYTKKSGAYANFVYGRMAYLGKYYVENLINRNPNTAHVPVSPDLMNLAQATTNLKTEAAAMRAFMSEGYKAAGTYSAGKLQEAKNKRDAATILADGSAEKAALLAEATELEKIWGKDGVGRAALHALVGGAALGSSAALANAGMVVSTELREQIALSALNALPKSIRDDATAYDAVNMALTTLMGAAIGGGQGAVATFNADANNRQLHPVEAEAIVLNASRFAKILYKTAKPSSEQMQVAMAFLASTAEYLLQEDQSNFRALFNQEAFDFLNTLRTERMQASGTLDLGDSQQFFYANDEQRKNTTLNAGLIDESWGKIILKTSTNPLINQSNGIKDAGFGVDKNTGLPLDSTGRYTVIRTVTSGNLYEEGKTFALKFYPCADRFSSNCVANDASLDLNDPTTAAYHQALSANARATANTAATIATFFPPTSIIGRIASATGNTLSAYEIFLGDDKVKSLISTTGSKSAEIYLKSKYKISEENAARVIALIELHGGWDRFSTAVMTQLQSK
jgi:filamentous hemagglutinin family protein